jgi:hypothetical protein
MGHRCLCYHQGNTRHTGETHGTPMSMLPPGKHAAHRGNAWDTDVYVTTYHDDATESDRTDRRDGKLKEY